MILYYSSNPKMPLTIRSCRLLSTAALASYPIGAIAVSKGGQSVALTGTGYGLILLSLFLAITLMSSAPQRIVAAKADHLDEYELKLRSKAMALAYGVIAVVTLAALVYAAIASDAGGWVPRRYGEYNAIFWGYNLLASLMPTTVLSWQLDDSFDGAA